MDLNGLIEAIVIIMGVAGLIYLIYQLITKERTIKEQEEIIHRLEKTMKEMDDDIK